jgi:hypothetical protein
VGRKNRRATPRPRPFDSINPCAADERQSHFFGRQFVESVFEFPSLPFSCNVLQRFVYCQLLLVGRKRLERLNEGVLALLLALTFLELKRMFDGGVTHAGPFARCIVANRYAPVRSVGDFPLDLSVGSRFGQREIRWLKDSRCLAESTGRRPSVARNATLHGLVWALSELSENSGGPGAFLM